MVLAETAMESRVRIAIVAILFGTVVEQMVPGINSVLLPVTLQKLGINNTMIGICLSCEILAIVCISRYMSTLISRFGMAKSIYLAGILQILVLYVLMRSRNYSIWAAAIFFYGLSKCVYLVALQTWMNIIPLTRFKGLIIGMYSASLSMGVALGPVLLHFIGIEGDGPFWANIVLTVLALIPFIVLKPLIPRFYATETPRIGFVIRLSPAVFYSALVGGISFFGLPAFLTLFALKNGMPVGQASFLITMFMLGSISLGMFFSFLSDFWDRRYVIIVCVAMGLLCAVYLSIAIYNFFSSLFLLYLWGGVMGGIYATGLTIVGERFRLEDQISANVAYTLMDGIGGVGGILLIGAAMDALGSEGLAYVIVSASVVYFIFALSRYNVE
jgi:MFS family permease